MRRLPCREYSVSEIEQLAAAVLSRAFPASISIPVDIELLLEREPHVVLDVVRGLQCEFGVAGATMCHPVGIHRQVTVIIDDEVADGPAPFYRFTAAEEFGHVRLHRAILDSITTLEDVIELHRSPTYARLDRNAKRFAAAILMPPRPLRQDAAAEFRRLSLRATSAEGLFAQLTARLAQRYEVSPQAMRFRLGEWPVQIRAAVMDAFGRRASELQLSGGA